MKRREFEALWTVFPLVPDEILAKAWKALPQYRPNEKDCFDRWRRQLGNYYRTQEGEGAEAKKIDPADPVKGHGAELVKALKGIDDAPHGAFRRNVGSRLRCALERKSSHRRCSLCSYRTRPCQAGSARRRS